MSKQQFKVGQDIWFRFENNRPAPVSVLGRGKEANTYDICSLEGICILPSVSEEFLYPTKEEAENGK